MLSPVPADTAAPQAVSPTVSPGCATRGSRSGCPTAASARSGSQVPAGVAKYPVPDASPRSVTMPGVAPSPPGLAAAAASRSASRAAAARRPRARRWPARGSASQRSLVTVNDAVGTLPVWLAHQDGPPSSLVSSAAAAADRRSFQSSAGLTTSPASSRTIMPCCCPATPTAPARSSRPSPACCSAAHQAAGSASVPAGCGALPRPTTVPSPASHSTTLVDWVEESTPATSTAAPSAGTARTGKLPVSAG